MLVGFALGLFRMVVDTPVSLGLAGYEQGYTPGSFLWIVNNIYFQYFSVLITIVSAVVMVVVSLMTAEPDYCPPEGIDVRDGDREGSQRKPRELGLARRRLIGVRARLHSRRVLVLHRLEQRSRSGEKDEGGSRTSEASEPARTERGSWGPASERVGGSAGAKPPRILKSAGGAAGCCSA